MPAKSRKAQLTTCHWELIGQFNHAGFESELSFEEAAKRIVGPNPFPDTPTGRLFRSEALKVFNQERAD
jgi:hypothetical protein